MTQATGAASADLLMAVEADDVTAGTAGFLVIAALVVGTVFLLRSLSKQLKKVDFEETDDGTGDSADDSADDSAGESDGEPPSGTTEAEAPVPDEPEEGPRSPQG